ncbi:MAG: acyl-CoA dehydratase activase-related protein [Frisingicoccus sp.]
MVCFPAKLVHGHIRNLVEKKVDRIFAVIPTVTSENTEKSESMCAVVKAIHLLSEIRIIRKNDGITFDHLYSTGMERWTETDSWLNI